MCIGFLSPIFGCKNSTPTDETKTSEENAGENEKTDSENTDETKSNSKEDEKSAMSPAATMLFSHV